MIQKASSSRLGFTLIELLVVIAIIAILAAILFPVFAKVREKARQTSCLSNEKQLGLSILQYVQDNDEEYPIGCERNFWDETWTIQIQPYVKSLAVFSCPDDSNQNVGSGPGGGGVGISYAANASYSWPGAGMQYTGAMEDDYGWSSFVDTASSTTASISCSDAEINYPTASILLAEKLNSQVMTFEGASNNSAGNNSVWGPGATFVGGTLIDNYSPGETPSGTAPAGTWPNGPDGAVSTPHTNMANFLFCDGHAKAMIPTATNPDPVNQPQNNMWNVRRS